jgi:hypothetical protein
MYYPFSFILVRLNRCGAAINYLVYLLCFRVKEKIAANLANFAYDPFNYAFIRQVC